MPPISGFIYYLTLLHNCSAGKVVGLLDTFTLALTSQSVDNEAGRMWLKVHNLTQAQKENLGLFARNDEFFIETC
jgi:hypothetical protein